MNDDFFKSFNDHFKEMEEFRKRMEQRFNNFNHPFNEKLGKNFDNLFENDLSDGDDLHRGDAPLSLSWVCRRHVARAGRREFSQWGGFVFDESNRDDLSRGSALENRRQVVRFSVQVSAGLTF